MAGPPGGPRAPLSGHGERLLVIGVIGVVDAAWESPREPACGRAGETALACIADTDG
jgi:hypothetical protein